MTWSILLSNKLGLILRFNLRVLERVVGVVHVSLLETLTEVFLFLLLQFSHLLLDVEIAALGKSALRLMNVGRLAKAFAAVAFRRLDQTVEIVQCARRRPHLAATNIIERQFLGYH